MDDIDIMYDKLTDDQKQIYDCIGEEAFIKLAVLINGDRVYMPSVDTILRPIRNVKIIKEYNGFNHRYLAKKYGLNERTIRGIVKDFVIKKRNEPLEGQITFDDLLRQK